MDDSPDTSEKPDNSGIGRTAFIGIGNTLAGDDGAGIVALGRLRSLLPEQRRCSFLWGILEGDLYAVCDFFENTRRFIFLDATGDGLPGELFTITRPASREQAYSFHHTDICTVMETLRILNYRLPFPLWEVRGISISIPYRLQQGLSPQVDRSVDRLAQQLINDIMSGRIS